MFKSCQPVIDIQANAQAVAKRAAAWLVTQMRQDSHKVSICLAGGSTPKVLYQTLAESPFYEEIPWHKVHWFWGDERYVQKDNALSNFRMVEEVMLARCPVPEKNIHAMRTDFSDPHEAALSYEQELQSWYGSDQLDSRRPLFDITLLGLGVDGHTASLFPNTDVLQERRRWACAVLGVKPEARITLTYPALESSQTVAFLVTGHDKETIAREILSGSSKLPAAQLRPLGTVHWFLDEAAYPKGQ